MTLRLLVLILMVPMIAGAQDLPCRAVGTGPLATVSCRRDAFDDLMDRMIEDEAELKKQEVRLKEAARANVDLRMALSACIGHGVDSKKHAYPALPILLTALGGAVIGSSIAGQWPSGGRTVGVVVGSAVVSTGLIVALF